MKVESHVHPMAASAPLLALLVISVLTVSGCSGGGGDSATSSTTSSTGTGTGGPTTSPVVTITQTSTISGTVTTITTTMTQTSSSSGGPPPVLPAINNVSAIPAANSAVVGWNVTGGTGVLSSHVEYGFSSIANFTSQTATIPGEGDHVQTLPSLASCNDYKFRIAATDGAGTTVRTAAQTFTTLPGPALAASAISVTSVIDTGFSVQWTVAGPVDARSHVEYGTTAAYGSTTADLMGTGTKGIAITGLSAATDYNFRISMTSPCGTATSANIVQKTAKVEHVDINGNFAGLHSFKPGSTADGSPMNVDANKPLVFDIKNLDTVTHRWVIDGLTPAYGSPDITAGNTYHFPISVTLAPNTYTMKCTIHPTMTGTIKAA